MSVGPMGMASSIAGTAQSRGNDVERSQQEDTVQQRKTRLDQQAESAAGVGETAEDQEASERDADGRRMWEQPAEGSTDASGEGGPAESPQSKDATGQTGANLDLSG